MTELKFALSIEEAADYTGIGRNTLRNLVEWEKLPILRVGRKILIRRERLDEFRMSSGFLSELYRIKICMHLQIMLCFL